MARKAGGCRLSCCKKWLRGGLTLVGHDEDECSGTLDGLGNVGNGNDVVTERNVGEVLDVDVGGVDDVGELLAVNLRRHG